MNLKLTSMLTALASAAIFSGTALAQKNYRSSNDSYTQGVTIYEHCGFQGKSQTLNVGEYASLRRVGFGNDSVSSIRVPKGFEVVIYQDDDYRGSYARIDQSIKCFDRKWNDEASSISVMKANEAKYRDAYKQGQSNQQGYDGRDYDNRNYENSSHNKQSQNRVTGNNVARVIFDGAALQQISTKQWKLDRRRIGSTQFDEIRRDRDSVYLENKYTAERVRIDLFANDVTIISRAGQQQRYSIQSKNAALPDREQKNRNKDARSTVNKTPKNVISGNCFHYKAYTTHGNGYVRFYTKDVQFTRFNKRPITGKICHKGSLRMELGKNVKKTDVIVEINGQAYRFAPGEREQDYFNTWYRKSINLKVGKY